VMANPSPAPPWSRLRASSARQKRSKTWSACSGVRMTPVFATPEELARYCADNGVSSFGSDTASYETWLKFINGPAWAPSAVMQDGVMRSGVESF